MNFMANDPSLPRKAPRIQLVSLNAKFDRMSSYLRSAGDAKTYEGLIRKRKRGAAVSLASDAAESDDAIIGPINAYASDGRSGPARKVARSAQSEISFWMDEGDQSTEKPRDTEPLLLPKWMSAAFQQLEEHHPLRRAVEGSLESTKRLSQDADDTPFRFNIHHELAPSSDTLVDPQCTPRSPSLSSATKIATDLDVNLEEESLLDYSRQVSQALDKNVALNYHAAEMIPKALPEHSTPTWLHAGPALLQPTPIRPVLSRWPPFLNVSHSPSSPTIPRRTLYVGHHDIPPTPFSPGLSLEYSAIAHETFSSFKPNDLVYSQSQSMSDAGNRLEFDFESMPFGKPGPHFTPHKMLTPPPLTYATPRLPVLAARTDQYIDVKTGLDYFCPASPECLPISFEARNGYGDLNFARSQVPDFGGSRLSLSPIINPEAISTPLSQLSATLQQDHFLSEDLQDDYLPADPFHNQPDPDSLEPANMQPLQKMLQPVVATRRQIFDEQQGLGAALGRINSPDIQSNDRPGRFYAAASSPGTARSTAVLFEEENLSLPEWTALAGGSDGSDSIRSWTSARKSL